MAESCRSFYSCIFLDSDSGIYLLKLIFFVAKAVPVLALLVPLKAIEFQYWKLTISLGTWLFCLIAPFLKIEPFWVRSCRRLGHPPFIILVIFRTCFQTSHHLPIPIHLSSCDGFLLLTTNLPILVFRIAFSEYRPFQFRGWSNEGGVR